MYWRTLKLLFSVEIIFIFFSKGPTQTNLSDDIPTKINIEYATDLQKFHRKSSLMTSQMQPIDYSRWRFLLLRVIDLAKYCKRIQTVKGFPCEINFTFIAKTATEQAKMQFKGFWRIISTRTTLDFSLHLYILPDLI